MSGAASSSSRAHRFNGHLRAFFGGCGELAPTAVSARGMKAATVTVNAGAPLIIEFVGGIPAAGKTTIARACRALGTSLGYPVYLNVKGLSRLQTVRAFLRLCYGAFCTMP